MRHYTRHFGKRREPDRRKSDLINFSMAVQALANMSTPAHPKIVYLFGAGATHAEIIESHHAKASDAKFLDEKGLLMDAVSRRVCEKARNDGVFSQKIQNLLSPAGLSNVELFISLVKNNQIKSEVTIESLENLIKKDISSRLRKSQRTKFYLHKSLMELHKESKKEALSGFISLNYDDILEEAFIEIFEKKPDYGFSSVAQENNIPLLKLHGGFSLKYRKHHLPILTPGANKNYLQLPYNFIWGRALELLIGCDILRVIGCSLSQNDIGLIDLLFKAHLERDNPFEVQIVSFDPLDNKIKQQYGFLPNIKTATEIEGGIGGGIISDPAIRDHTTGSNPFKIWLKAKVEKMLTTKDLEGIQNTTYLKMLLE